MYSFNIHYYKGKIMKKLFQLWRKIKLANSLRKDVDSIDDIVTINLTDHEFWYCNRYFQDYMLAVGENENLINMKKLKELTLEQVEYIPNERKAEWVADFKAKLSSYYTMFFQAKYNGYIILKCN